MAACLGFGWAATFVESGLGAFNENTARGPSSDRRQRQTAFRHSAVAAGAAAGSGVSALDTPRFDKLMARQEFGEFWRIHVILF